MLDLVLQESARKKSKSNNAYNYLLERLLLVRAKVYIKKKKKRMQTYPASLKAGYVGLGVQDWGAGQKEVARASVSY